MKLPSLLFLVFSLNGLAQTTASSAGPLTNLRVIQLVQAGLSAAEVARIISSASAVDFNLTPAFTNQLLQYGVSEDTIRLMSARENGVGVTPTALAASAPSAKAPEAPRMTTVGSVTEFGAKDWMLHEGTPVRLRLMRNLSSATAVEGATVDFETLDDISVNGVIVIPRNSVALATITSAEAKKRMGRAGKLSVNIDYVRLPSGEKLALRGIENPRAGSHVGAMTGAIVATSIVFWPAAPFFLFIHGKDATIPEGHEVRVYVNSDYKVLH